MFKFITHRHFLVNLLVAILLAAGLIFGALQLLGSFTKHGEFLKVPSVLNKETNAAIKNLESKGFNVVIMDSVYVDSLPRGTIIKQIPDPNSLVKVNRTILLLVNRVTLPLLDVPLLQGKSLSYAIELIKRSHFVLGDTTFRPDFMAGSVLEQNHKGAAAPSGSKLPYGSVIDLVVGGGLSDRQIAVPDLVGMTFSQAKALLDADFISFGAIISDETIRDTANAFIIRQSPERYNKDDITDPLLMYIQSGQLIDVWISQSNKVPLLDSIEAVKPTKPKSAPKPNGN